MSKIVELTVSKGRTIQSKDGEWLKLEYTIKTNVDNDSELQAAKASMLSVIDTWLNELPITQASAATPTAAPKHQPKSTTVEDVKRLFPTDLVDLLMFEQKPDCITIKPRRFLGSENFAKIASIVKAQGGNYVSAGKASHFRLPLKQ
jgi:hypothetical protein